jgi:hypothetical protein
MPKKPKQSYKELRDIWYRKLKEDGFRDVERAGGLMKADNSSAPYIQTHAGYRRFSQSSRSHMVRTHNEGIAEYFRLAGHFLYEHDWDNPRNKRIWELHSQGYTAAHIAARFKLTAMWVQKVLWKIADEMKIKYNVIAPNEEE